jgi:DNA gyrase subunit B
MTDADVDGAHIRTLLLTFFFRQMQQLFLSDMIFIAQPPLYEIRVKGKKKSEYILSESQMHKRMITRGLEGTELVIKDGDSTRKVSDGQLAGLVKALADAERIIAVLGRRGISFTDFVQAYYNGDKLPRFRVCVQGQEEIYYEKSEYENRLDELGERIKVQAEGGEEESIIAEELHEVVRINQTNEKLKTEFGLDLNDFLLKPARAVSGEALPTKFQLINGQDKYDIASLGEICSSIRQIGGKGIEMKRFKGLGEMNADQLWETTMNPATRTLLSVKLDDAGEADRLFSILMGGDVEKRRAFIRDHALEVQNLDI